MAEPGTVTHVVEVAARLATAAETHAGSIVDAASAAVAIPPAAEAPPAGGG